MKNLITWEKSSLTGSIYGATKQEVENDEIPTYSIEGTTVKYCEREMKFINIRCASIEDAKQLVEIVERGRVAE
jgi:hypothetical protein